MLDRFGIVQVPILMEAQYHVLVPGWQHAIVIIPPAISFNDDDMTVIYFTDRFGNILQQLFQWYVVLFLQAVLIVLLIFETIVRLIQDVICTNVRLIAVTFCQLLP